MRKPEMRKKMVTPTSSRAVYGPYHVLSFEWLSDEVWVRTTQTTAIARSESRSGKRGCPGGGARAGGVDRSIDADGGTRTPKGIAHRVLSAARLPVPPHPRGGDSN